MLHKQPNNKNILFGMKRFLSLILLAGITIDGFSQRILSLDSCRNLAIQNNKELRIAQEKINAAHYNKKAAFTNYLPKFDIMATYMRTQKEISLLSDEQKNSISNIGTGSTTATTISTNCSIKSHTGITA